MEFGRVLHGVILTLFFLFYNFTPLTFRGVGKKVILNHHIKIKPNMQRKDSPKKLVLNKERIAQLTEREMQSVMGGDGSTLNNFTCTLCTSGYGNPNPYLGMYNMNIYAGYNMGGGVSVGGSVNPYTGAGSVGIYIKIP